MTVADEMFPRLFTFLLLDSHGGEPFANDRLVTPF